MIANVMTAIYDILVADVALLANLGAAKIYHVVAPQSAEAPYIVFGNITDMPISTFAEHDAIEELTVFVNVWGKEDNAASGVLTTYGLMDDALDRAALVVTGYTNMVCERDYTGTVGFDPDTKLFSIPTRYRVLVDKN